MTTPASNVIWKNTDGSAAVADIDGNGVIAYSYVTIQYDGWNYQGAYSEIYSNFTGLNEAQKLAIQQGFSLISSYTGLSFQAVSYDPANLFNIDIKLQAVSELSDPFLGYSYGVATPPTEDNKTPGAKGTFGWVAYDNSEGMATPTYGSIQYSVILHEMGHTLGLIDIDRTIYKDTVFDDSKFTVMSDDIIGTLGLGANPVVTYMPLDILALQALYGLPAANLTNNTYTFDTPEKLYRQTIWDAGGIDTYDASASPVWAFLDLRPGFHSTIGPAAGDGHNIANPFGVSQIRAALDAYGKTNVPVTVDPTIENAVGTAYNDQIVGNHVANTLYGLAGNDAIRGGAGSDILIGGAGNDILDGSSNNLPVGSISTGDRALFGIVDDVDSAADVDVANYSETMRGNEGITTGIVVSMSGVNGTVSNDGHGSSDTLVSIEKIVGTSFVDDINLSGSSVGMQVVAGGGADTIRGSAHNDRLEGGDGYDWIEGGAGADYINTGNNGGLVSYKSSPAGITINNLGSATTFRGGDAEGDTVASSDFEGSEFNDYINLYISVARKLYGLGGNDTLFGGNYTDSLFGGAGNDSIYAGNGDDWIEGDIGNDILHGEWGIDQIFGGPGDDQIFGGTENDILYGGEGRDLISGGDGADTIYFSSTGGILSYADSTGGITVDLGNRTFHGGSAEGDVIVGTILEFKSASNGTNTITGTSSADIITEGNGAANDTLYGLGGDDYLSGGGGEDTIYGGDGNDTIYGGWGDDTIYGGDGNDWIDAGSTEPFPLSSNLQYVYGGNGNDTIRVGQGINHVYGDNGADTIIFDASNMNYLHYDTSYAAVSLNGISRFGSGGDAAGDSWSGNVGYVVGSNFDDSFVGFNSSTEVYGNYGSDYYDGTGYFWGDQGDDAIFGARTGYGGDGDDFFFGGSGTNTFFGGSGSDTFVFLKQSQQDIIRDYDSSDVIRIDLNLAQDSTSLLEHAVEEFGGVSFKFPGNGLSYPAETWDTLRFDGVSLAGLNLGNFVFGEPSLLLIA